MSVQVHTTIPYYVYSTNEQELINKIEQEIPGSDPVPFFNGSVYSWFILKEQIPLFE